MRIKWRGLELPSRVAAERATARHRRHDDATAELDVAQSVGRKKIFRFRLPLISEIRRTRLIRHEVSPGQISGTYR